MKYFSSLKQKSLKWEAVNCFPDVYLFSVHFFCVWDNYLPYAVIDLIPGSIEENNNWNTEASLFQLKFVSVLLTGCNLQQLFTNLGQFGVGGNLNCITTLSQSRSEITCQAGNGKLQHFIGKVRAKILCSNLLQSKSASYLSLSEIVCNKFPPDAVSTSNCFYCILEAFHT